MTVRASMFPAPPPWSRQITTIGVTGTNGKTTTTTWLAAALSALARPVLRITTVGTWLGEEKLDVPATYDGFVHAMQRAASEGARFAAIELTSEALGLGFARAWPISIGVFTNLTRDHLDAHGSPEHYLASKAQLFVFLPEGGTAILNAWDKASALLAEVVPKGVTISCYGSPGRAEGPPILEPIDIVAEAVTLEWAGTRIRLGPSERYRLLPKEMFLRAVGEVFAENAVAALSAALAAGVPAAEAAEAIERAAAPEGRFQVLGEGPRVVVDYAHSPDALSRTIKAARCLAEGKVTVVFGAGGDRDKGKRAQMGESARSADGIVLTSDNPRSEDPALIAADIRAGVGAHPSVVENLDRREAILQAIAAAGPLDVVIIAGRGPETKQIFAGREVRLVDAEVATQGLARRLARR